VAPWVDPFWYDPGGQFLAVASLIVLAAAAPTWAYAKTIRDAVRTEVEQRHLRIEDPGAPDSTGTAAADS